MLRILSSSSEDKLVRDTEEIVHLDISEFVLLSLCIEWEDNLLYDAKDCRGDKLFRSTEDITLSVEYEDELLRDAED